MLYCSPIYFDYCCEVWDVFGESQSKRLKKLQNRAARIILNMSNDVNHSIALRALGWEPLKTERKKRKTERKKREGKNDVQSIK